MHCNEYAGVDLRDVQIAARHADPRTAMRYDRARKNLDRHPSYTLAAYRHQVPDQVLRNDQREIAILPMSVRCIHEVGVLSALVVPEQRVPLRR